MASGISGSWEPGEGFKQPRVLTQVALGSRLQFAAPRTHSFLKKILVMLHGMRDLSFPTRDRNYAPCFGSAVS